MVVIIKKRTFLLNFLEHKHNEEKIIHPCRYISSTVYHRPRHSYTPAFVEEWSLQESSSVADPIVAIDDRSPKATKLREY